MINTLHKNTTAYPTFTGNATQETYEYMEDFLAFARCGFVESLPGVLIDHKFKHCRQNSFFRDVYDRAVLMNPDWADALDCGILK